MTYRIEAAPDPHDSGRQEEKSCDPDISRIPKRVFISVIGIDLYHHTIDQVLNGVPDPQPLLPDEKDQYKQRDRQ